MRIIKQLIYCLLVIIAVLIGITFSAHVYNYNFHPLVKLSDQISSDDNVETVRNLLRQYKEKYEKNGVLQLIEEYPDSACDRLKRDNVKGCFTLFDDSIFYTVQLAIYFDQEGKVVDKIYIGD